MKDNLSNPGAASGMPFLLAQSTGQQVKARPKLAGFAKVLAGGRVVGLKREAPFADRMIGFNLGSSPNTSHTQTSRAINIRVCGHQPGGRSQNAR